MQSLSPMVGGRWIDGLTDDSFQESVTENASASLWSLFYLADITGADLHITVPRKDHLVYLFQSLPLLQDIEG